MNLSANFLYHEIILASASPQRFALLKEYGFRFLVCPANIEEILDPNLSPEKNAEKLAKEKARAVRILKRKQIVLAADTIVVSPSGKMLGKPKNKNHAREMLLEKRGQKERIITGYCLLSDEKEVSGFEVSEVRYTNFSEEQREEILKTDEWKNVAGALRIEGEKMKGIVKEITGDYQNIIGLPLGKIAHILRDFPV